MKIVAVSAGVVLLIVGGVFFALVAILALPGSSTDADTWLGAAVFLVVALLAALMADVLLIVGLRQPVARPARPSRYRKRISRPALVLSAPLIFLVVLIARVATRLSRAPTRPAGQVGEAPAASPTPQGQAATGPDAGGSHPPPATDHPAIAAMLVHPVSLRWEAAFMATLIELACRRHIVLAEQAGWLRCRAPSAPTPDLLAGFERILLDRVADRLAAGDAPVQALLPDYQDEEGNLWFRRFESAVLDDAHRRGLAGSPQSRPIFWPFMSEATSRGADRAALNRWLEMRDSLRTTASPPRLPESGAAVDDPTLAWAVALGAAEDVLMTLLPPAPWSSFGGRWHPVPVPRSSKGPVPRWRLRRPRPDQTRTFTARVVRRWTRTDSSEYGSYTHRFVAVDDGRAAEAIVYRVGPDQFGRTRRDCDVLVTVDHKGRLADITPIDPLSPNEPPPSP